MSASPYAAASSSRPSASPTASLWTYLPPAAQEAAAATSIIAAAARKTVIRPWWNGPAIVLVCELPFLIFAIAFQKWGILCGAGLAFAGYYAVYEYLHWCMHLPRKRNVERSGIFFRLNGHHLLHHRYMHKNFNVVLPLADVLFGTFIPRSKVAFAQACGESVPDVQPLNLQFSPQK